MEGRPTRRGSGGRGRGKKRERRGGLRGRLTRMFALVAVLAVAVTTSGTVNSAFRVIDRLNPELGLGSLWDGGGTPIPRHHSRHTNSWRATPGVGSSAARCVRRCSARWWP
ncbi:hypothetical protein ACFP9V_21765 [Deinococcus radiopugnans]|uniref:hypothetical protein n=1 Tax=Deinococcus radiopugnans TaxID=57497 RepID=UPI00360D1C48